MREVVRLGGRAERRAYLARALTSDFIEFSARPRKLSAANVRAFRRQQREHVRPPDQDCSCCGGEAEEEGAGEGAAKTRTPPIADLEEAERAIQALEGGGAYAADRTKLAQLRAAEALQRRRTRRLQHNVQSRDVDATGAGTDAV